MAVYKIAKYNRKTKDYRVDYDIAPSNVGFWVQNKAISAKEGIKVRYSSRPTKDKMNRKVVRVNVDFRDGETWEYTLQNSKSMGFKRGKDNGK